MKVTQRQNMMIEHEEKHVEERVTSCQGNNEIKRVKENLDCANRKTKVCRLYS